MAGAPLLKLCSHVIPLLFALHATHAVLVQAVPSRLAMVPCMLQAVAHAQAPPLQTLACFHSSIILLFVPQ